MLPLITAAIGAATPLITEILRDKPDPEAAKTLVQSKRQEMVERAIGGGLQPSAAEKQVDEQIAAAMEEADRQGQFNFPGGEMLGMAILGGVGGGLGGMALKKFAPGLAAKLGMKQGAGQAAATGGSAAAGSPAAGATASRVGDTDDVYRAGFQSPAADAMRRGAGDRVIPMREGGRNIGYDASTERGFTMRDPDVAPFPARGRGEFNVEVIGSTGGVRSAPVTIEGPFPSMARGGERIGMAPQPRRIGMEQPAPEVPGITGEIVGTPATPSPFPASLQRSMARRPGIVRGEVGEAFDARRGMQDQIRRQQMERAWEEQQLMERIGL